MANLTQPYKNTTEIQIWPIARLVPYIRNPRKNDGVVDRMVGSIQEFGFKIPVLARSDGQVVDGHLRLKAAQRLGIGEVPVILCDEWTEAQVKAFRLLVNRSVTWADWDDDLLRLEIADLRDLNFDLSLTGFDPDELAELEKPGTGNTDEDAILEPPAIPVSRCGDVWRCGEHFVVCADSTSTAAVSRLLAQTKPALLVTDPPYGVDYDPAWRNEAAKAGKIQFAARREGRVQNDDRIDWSAAYALFPGDVAYIWHASAFGSLVQDSIEACNFWIRSQVIWAKTRFAISRGHYHWQHEACWYAVREGKTAHWSGGRKQTTLWSIPSVEGDEAKNNHSTQKPVECMRRPIQNHTKEGDWVYDPFVGSGTTIIAAETIRRKCLAVDIDPGYVDVAVQRWQQFTGREAVLESGETWHHRQSQSTSTS